MRIRNSFLFNLAIIGLGGNMEPGTQGPPPITLDFAPADAELVAGELAWWLGTVRSCHFPSRPMTRSLC